MHFHIYNVNKDVKVTFLCQSTILLPFYNLTTVSILLKSGKATNGGKGVHHKGKPRN